MTPLGRPGRSAEDYRELVTRLLRSAEPRSAPLVTFLEEVTQILLEISRSGAVVVRLEEWTPAIRSRAIRRRAAGFRFETERVDTGAGGGRLRGDAAGALCRALLRGARAASAPSLHAARRVLDVRRAGLPADPPPRSHDRHLRLGPRRRLPLSRASPLPCRRTSVRTAPDDPRARRALRRGGRPLLRGCRRGRSALALTHHRVQWALPGAGQGADLPLRHREGRRGARAPARRSF